MTEENKNDIGQEGQPEMLVNDYGAAIDPTVVVDEADRTVVLTPNETLVIDKQPTLGIVPKNRPRKVYGGMWGQAEIATVGVAMLALLTALLVFVFLVIPSNKELEKNRAERDRLERELRTANDKYGNITSTETQVAKLVSSVNDFEMQNLPVASAGRNAVYQRINGLISAYGLVNTTGPDYVPLETADQEKAQQTEEEKGRAKYRSLFPGMYVTTTVEGSYQSLRRFIAEIERSSEFVVISAIELQPSDSSGADKPAIAAPQPVQNGNFPRPGMPFNNPNAGPQIQAQRPVPNTARGKTHGETVSLRLEMAAYFRRPTFVPAEPGSVVQ